MFISNVNLHAANAAWSDPIMQTVTNLFMAVFLSVFEAKATLKSWDFILYMDKTAFLPIRVLSFVGLFITLANGSLFTVSPDESPTIKSYSSSLFCITNYTCVKYLTFSSFCLSFFLSLFPFLPSCWVPHHLLYLQVIYSYWAFSFNFSLSLCLSLSFLFALLPGSFSLVIMYWFYTAILVCHSSLQLEKLLLPNIGSTRSAVCFFLLRFLVSRFVVVFPYRAERIRCVQFYCWWWKQHSSCTLCAIANVLSDVASLSWVYCKWMCGWIIKIFFHFVVFFTIGISRSAWFSVADPYMRALFKRIYKNRKDNQQILIKIVIMIIYDY